VLKIVVAFIHPAGFNYVRFEGEEPKEPEQNAIMKNSKLPWRKTPGNRPSHFQCADEYNIGSVNSAATTEGEANLNLIITAVNEHAALVAVAEAAKELASKARSRIPNEWLDDAPFNDALCLCEQAIAAIRAGSEVAK